MLRHGIRGGEARRWPLVGIDILQRAWFTRTWVIQEPCVSQSPWGKGDYVLDWDAIWHACDTIQGNMHPGDTFRRAANQACAQPGTLRWKPKSCIPFRLRRSRRTMRIKAWPFGGSHALSNEGASEEISSTTAGIGPCLKPEEQLQRTRGTRICPAQLFDDRRTDITITTRPWRIRLP